MSTALLIGLVVIAALACPAMMWWQRRRGNEVACCLPAKQERGEPAGRLDELRSQHARIGARIAAMEGAPGQHGTSNEGRSAEAEPAR